MTRPERVTAEGGITGVLLAGGENRRFPVLKGFIKSKGSTIISRNLSILRENFSEVFISTNSPELYFSLGAEMIGDILPSQGPMSGIYSCLVNAEADCIFVLACDMPLVEPELVRLVCDLHRASASGGKTADASIPVFNNEPQPLFGVYCKSVLPHLKKGILAGKTALRRLLDEINTNFIDEMLIKAVDPEGSSFVNINTVEDYEKMTGGKQPEILPPAG